MRIVRGRLLHWPNNNWRLPEYLEDGVMLIEAGKIMKIGPVRAFVEQGLDLSGAEYYPGHLILPGFIDPHLHFPQIDVMASYGAQLLDWLNDYTFPQEAQYADAEFAQVAAESFISLLLKNGTTTAFAFGSSHATSVEALFAEADRHNMRMVAGKVLMDQNAPENLLDTATTGIAESEALIQRWHGKGRLGYAITPRFSATSSELQLRAAGQLSARYPEVWVQSHLSENRAELNWIQQIHPSYGDYLATYEDNGLLHRKSLMGHCIYLSESEIERFAKAGAVAVFCPTSNLFLGSGLMPFQALKEAGISLGMASDVGGGTSINLLETLADAYKVCQLQGYSLHPYEAFHAITRGNAAATELDDSIGSFQVGGEADFVRLDPEQIPLVARRLGGEVSLRDELFVYMTLGDERLVVETTVDGRAVYQSETAA